MDKKIKILDLLSLLDFVLYLGFIIFIIISFVYYYQWNDRQNNILTTSQETLVKIVFIVSMILLGISVIMNVSLSIFMFKTNWRNEEINNSKKLYFWLSIILVTIAIPLIIFTRKITSGKYKNNKPVITNKNENIENNFEAYYEDGVWKYYDGKDYWIMNEQNEWVKEIKEI